MEKRGLSFSWDVQHGQTRTKEKPFENAVQEQQKTLPPDHVVRKGVQRGKAASGASPGDKQTHPRPAMCLLSRRAVVEDEREGRRGNGRSADRRGPTRKGHRRGRRRDRETGPRRTAPGGRIPRRIEAYHEQGQKDSARKEQEMTQEMSSFSACALAGPCWK